MAAAPARVLAGARPGDPCDTLAAHLILVVTAPDTSPAEYAAARQSILVLSLLNVVLGVLRPRLGRNRAAA